MLTSLEATDALVLAATSLEGSALASAAKALARHASSMPETARSASTQQVVTAQQHLVMAMPTLHIAGGGAWVQERERIVQACLGSDQVWRSPARFMHCAPCCCKRDI